MERVHACLMSVLCVVFLFHGISYFVSEYNERQMDQYGLWRTGFKALQGATKRPPWK